MEKIVGGGIKDVDPQCILRRMRNLFCESEKLVTPCSLLLGFDLSDKENCIGLRTILSDCRMRDRKNLAGSAPRYPLFANHLIQKKESISRLLGICDPVGARTQDLQLRRLLLYPTELRNQHLMSFANDNRWWVLCECKFTNAHNALCVWDKQATPPPPPESQIPRSREIDSFFCIRWLAKCGYLGADPAKFSRSRILQSDKIGRNSMQFFSRSKSNPKRREHVVTNFSLSQKRLRILRQSYLIFSCELNLGTFLWLIAIAFLRRIGVPMQREKR